jgi:hypothetical protein
MPIVRFARTQQRTLLVTVVALVAAGAFGAGVWLGTQPLPGAGDTRAALAAEERAIALVGSSRAPAPVEDFEVIPAPTTGATVTGSVTSGPSASDVPPAPGPADPQEPVPSPDPDVPGPSPLPVPPSPDPVVDAVEDALNGVINSLPSAPLPTTAPTVTQTVTGAAGALLP